VTQCILEKLTSAVSRLSKATAVKHEFDATLASRGGGPVRYALEVDGRPFLAWFDEDTSVVVVTPLEKWNIDSWLDMADEPERIPVLAFREVDGRAFLRMAALAIADPLLPP
jgi:hypothetical protein